jgi:hypothetical protein
MLPIKRIDMGGGSLNVIRRKVLGVSNIKNGAIYPTKNFGDVEVVKYTDKYNIEIRFLNTGSTINVVASALRGGECVDYLVPTFLGVGYIGYGEYSTRSPCGKKKSRAYEYWSRMLKRCYDVTSKDYPDYGAKGITVCVEWHNFQNFAKWFYAQPFNDRFGYHLDKDLTLLGNKVYQPKACRLVPPCINTLGLFRYSEKFGRTSSGKWRHTVYETGRPSRSYETKEDCEKAYVIDKHKGLKNKVEQQYTLNNITEELYKHLLSLIEKNYPITVEENSGMMINE